IYVAATFQGATALLLDSKIEYKVSFPPEVPVDMIPAKVTITNSLDANRNLVTTTVVYNANGGVLQSQTNTDQRI
ncbi:MAG: hypothetical protein K2Q18_03340, partial [Bdellovibrionales bacterium]|nr:hypothetical protein [Bdellovibrionales bacterium]